MNLAAWNKAQNFSYLMSTKMKQIDCPSVKMVKYLRKVGNVKSHTYTSKGIDNCSQLCLQYVIMSLNVLQKENKELK